MAKFPGQLGQPPLSIPRLVAVKTSTLPTLHRNVTTPQTSSLSARLPTVYEYSTYPFALPLCLACLTLPCPSHAAPLPLPLHPLTASPLAGPPGMEASPAPRSPPFTKVDLVERPFPFGPSPLSHALLCQIRASMEYTRHCVVDLLRIAAALRVSACPAIIIASRQKAPM
ncbi:hypothetical protein HDV62DRAFT_207186 [Trichoderma sp. SZMC 28011]